VSRLDLVPQPFNAVAQVSQWHWKLPKPNAVQGSVAVSDVVPVVAGSKRMSRLPTFAACVGWQSRLKVPKKSFEPLTSQGWPLRTPPLQVPLAQSAPVVQTGVMAITRAWDDQILMAAFGTAQTGVQGGTAVPFPGTQSVAANYGAAANVGLTVAKMRKARQLLMGAGADLQMDEIHMAGTSFDHDNLLGETQIINSDYAGNEKAVLKDGVVDYFVGIRFHLVEFTDTVYEAQATMGGATRQLPVWLKSGLHLGVWGDITSRIDERADKSYATQWYVKTTCGAARVQEKKVVQLLCV